MGSIDYGSQTLGFDYNQSATAKLFNGVYYIVLPTGIYSGFTLAKVSDISVTVSSGLCVINDTANDTTVKVSTTSSVSLTVSSSTPYIVFRFDWSDSVNNYMDMLAVAYADIESDDLIVGRCIYNDAGTVLQSVFDYTRRSKYYLASVETQNNYFRVYQTEPASNKVTITGGVINTSVGNIVVSGGSFPSSGFTNTVNGRCDLIYINESGVISVLEGVDSSSPVVPEFANRKVIAYITRGASETTVKGNEITRVITSFDAAPSTEDLLISDAGSYYTATDVEDALQEIAGSDFSFFGTKTFDDSVVINACDTCTAITMTGSSGNNIEVIKKYGGTTVQYVDQNGKLYNNIGISLAFSDTYSKYTVDEVGSALNQIAGEAMTIAGSKIFTTMPTLGSSTTVGSSTVPAYLSSGVLTPCTSLSLNTTGNAATATKLGTSTVGSSIKPIYLNAGSPVAFSSTVGSETQQIYMSAGSITASTSTVGSSVIPTYLSSGVTKASTSTVGSNIKPIYLNAGALTVSTGSAGSSVNPIYLSSGTLTASSSTVGSSTKPIYMSSGTITASSSTVGNSGTPVYINSGTITAFSSTIGSGINPIYLANGTITASTVTVGSSTKPVYLNAGTITASSSTVGNSGTPIYMNAGTITVCSALIVPNTTSDPVNPVVGQIWFRTDV